MSFEYWAIVVSEINGSVAASAVDGVPFEQKGLSDDFAATREIPFQAG